MALIFRTPTAQDIPEAEAFKAEFVADGSTMDGAHVLAFATAEEWLAAVHQRAHESNAVPCLQYGLFEDGRLLGLIEIRLRLAGYLVEYGGHIGYCVRPSERRKGYAADMLRRALAVCREKGLDRVLVTCLETNLASARTIERCGGTLERVVYDDENYHAHMKRYWIDL